MAISYTYVPYDDSVAFIARDCNTGDVSITCSEEHPYVVLQQMGNATRPIFGLLHEVTWVPVVTWRDLAYEVSWLHFSFLR